MPRRTGGLLPTRTRESALLGAPFVVAALLALGGPTASAVVTRASVATLTAAADHVLIGLVTDSRSRWDPAGTSIVTDVSITVQEYFKSRTFPPRFTMTLPGGTIDGITVRAEHVPALARGDRIVVFLTDVAPAGVAIVGAWQGLFYIRGADAIQAESGTTFPVAELTARLRELIQVPPPAYGGSLMTRQSIEGLTRRAHHVVLGSVARVQSRITAAGDSIETMVDLQVMRSLKGGPGRSVALRLAGGAVGDLQVLAGGVPHFWMGERVLLFLEATGPELAIAGLWQGKFSVVADRAVQPETGSAVPLATIESRVAQALTTPAPLSESDVPVVVEAPYTTFCVPWTAAQTPVPHFVNPGNPGLGGPEGPAFVRLVQQALQAWQDVPGAWFTARVAGTTTRTATHHLDGNNDVAWASLDSFGTGVLGVNFCTLSGGLRLDSDTQFDNTGRWWSTTATSGSFDLDTVARHEFGHSAGLGHRFIDCDAGPETAIMCPSLAPGAEKVLHADDMEGLTVLYPLVGKPPPVPRALDATRAGPDVARLSWADVSGELAYEIQRSQPGCVTPFQAVDTMPANVTRYVDDDFGAGLVGGVHCYRIKALGQGGDSPFSDVASVALPGYFGGGVFVAVGNLDGPGAPAVLTGAGAGGGPHVRAFGVDGAPRATSFYAYAEGFRGGVRVAACDLDGDGRAEIVTGAGPGGGPHVRAFKLGPDGQPAAELASFYAYAPEFRGGVFVACGDVDGDGVPEIVTGADAGGGPHVRAVRFAPGTPGGVVPLTDFFAFDPSFTGGVRVAVANVDASDRASIVVGAGPGGGPHVRVLKLAGGASLPEELGSFYAYHPAFAGGVFVGAGNVLGDARAELVTGADSGGGPHVRLFTVTGTDAGLSMYAYDSSFRGGARVAIREALGGGLGEIITGAGPGGGPHVRGFALDGTLVAAEFLAY